MTSSIAHKSFVRASPSASLPTLSVSVAKEDPALQSLRLFALVVGNPFGDLGDRLKVASNAAKANLGSGLP